MDLWRKVLRSELLFSKEGTAAQEVAEVAQNKRPAVECKKLKDDWPFI